MRAVVYDRTSGDEGSTGQDPKAQLALTVELARRAGFEVVAEFSDADVQGDVDWEGRLGLARAMERTGLGGPLLFVREVSRLWRGDPARGLLVLEESPNLEVADAPVFARRDDAWVKDSDADYLMRFIALWQAWSEKRRLAVRTQQAMTEIKEGRRQTARPPGRPPVEIDPAHLEEARARLEQGHSMAAVHRRVLELRGFYAAKDPRTAKNRNVSKAKLGELLGRYGLERRADSVRNPDASETRMAEASEVSDAKGSLADTSGGGA